MNAASGDAGDMHVSFNAEAEIQDLKTMIANFDEEKTKISALENEVADLKAQNADMREKLDNIDGESAEIRLLLEKYQNR